MSACAALDTLLDAARGWHAALPALADFLPWPDDLIFAPRAPYPLPVIRHLQAAPGRTCAAGRPLRDALVAAAPHVEWRHTYTEAEVGRDFLDRFGWFELAGPDGHFLSRQARLTVGYWGPGLHYDWHQHLPEEIYSVVSGSGIFRVDNQADRRLGPGQTCFHKSEQRHALETQDEPILAFVMWRGAGLDELPRLSA